MPKAYTYTAEFNPISFADKIAPLKLYKEEYDKQQAAYEKLLEETADLGVLKDIAMDKASYDVYNNFKNDINSIASTMENEGLSPDVRNRLVELRKRRFTEIDPLLEKQKIRADLVKEQRKYRETHPNSIFDVDYDETPLDAITKESTFRPYDLDERLKKTSDTIYANIMNSNGVDTTNYDDIRSQLDYDNLSKKKQAVVDRMINLSKNSAYATYQIYKDREAMDRYRYGNRRGNNSSTTSTTGGQYSVEDILSGKGKQGTYNIPSIGGLSIPITVDKTGNIKIAGQDGRAYSFTDGKRINGETDDAYGDRIQKSLFKIKYGYDFDSIKTLPNGQNVLVMSSGNDRNKKYFIMNNKGKIIPVSDSSNSTILQEYNGKPLKYADNTYNQETKKYDHELITNSSGTELGSIDYDKYKIDDSNDKYIYSATEAVRDGLDITRQSAMLKLGIDGDDLKSEISDLFNNGYIIVKTPIVNKKNGTIYGYRYRVAEGSSVQRRSMDIG